jgi:hypothetical protein
MRARDPERRERHHGSPPRARRASDGGRADDLTRLQQTVGNRAVQRLVVEGLAAPSVASAASLQRFSISESAHYGDNRDDDHRKGKAALLAADSDRSISNKLFKKGVVKGGKLVTTFKTTGSRFIVAVTYASRKPDHLTYDTAYLSKAGASPMPGAVMYHPDTPVVPL